MDMARHLTLGLLLLLSHWAAGALRKAQRTGSAGFGDLVECKVAYDRLEDQCSRGQPATAPVSVGGQSEWGLHHDADGGIIVNTAAPHEPASYRRIPYRPPESGSGKPNDVSGWDYRLHGEDWQHLGNCGGPNQSPVDLPRYVDVQGQTKSLLWFDYYIDPDLKPSKVASLINDGHGLRYNVNRNGIDLGFVKIGGEEYSAGEYVFHAPSEHSLDGAVFPVELQVYHWPKNAKKEEKKGGVAVSVFFREGPSNAFLAALRKSMKGVAPSWSPVNGSSVGAVLGQFPSAFDLEAVIPRGDAAKERSFYNYIGSSTQPPCEPGVNWWVLSTPITATREELRFVRRALYTSPSMRHGNARSTMPLGNRSVSAALTGFQNALKPGTVPIWAHLDEAKEPRGYSSQDIPWGKHWTRPSSQKAAAEGDADSPDSRSKATESSSEAAANAADEAAAAEAAAEAASAEAEAEAAGSAVSSEETAPSVPAGLQNSKNASGSTDVARHSPEAATAEAEALAVAAQAEEEAAKA